jgi:hypothetical protein
MVGCACDKRKKIRQNNRTTERQNDRTTERPNDRTTERQNDRTTEMIRRGSSNNEDLHDHDMLNLVEYWGRRRANLLDPYRIRRTYLELRQKTLRDPMIKTELFSFMGVNLLRTIQNRYIWAKKTQRAYRDYRILHCIRVLLTEKMKERKMKSSANVIQCAYRCAKAREMARGMQC